MYLWSFAGMVNSQEIQRNDEQSSIIGFVKFNVFQRNLSTIMTCVVGLMFMVTADCIYLGGLSGTKQEIFLLLTSDLIDNNFFQSPQLHCFVMCFITARFPFFLRPAQTPQVTERILDSKAKQSEAFQSTKLRPALSRSTDRECHVCGWNE